jgi:hypothetical protein
VIVDANSYSQRRMMYRPMHRGVAAALVLLLSLAQSASLLAQRSATVGATRPLASDDPMPTLRVLPWARRTTSPIAERPRVGFGRIVLQVLAGVVGAWAAGAVAYNAVADAANDQAVKDDQGYSPAGNWGYVAGSMLGSTLGVYIVGSIGDIDGSFLATALGAAVPTLGLAANADDAIMALAGAIIVAPLQAAGATIGFNITRRRQGEGRTPSR